MKVDIVFPNLEISGTLKYLGGLASGFEQLGHRVRFLFTGEGPNHQLVESALGQVAKQRLASNMSHTISRWLETPVIKLFARGTFAPDQSVNILGPILSSQAFGRTVSDSDLVIYGNFWAYPAPRILQTKGPAEVLIFHEGIESSFLPYGLRQFLQTYVAIIARHVDFRMAITRPMASLLSRQGIEATPIVNGFWQRPWDEPKEPTILLDSRWTVDRDPARVIRIAHGVPSAKFLMIGRFPDLTVRSHLIKRISVENLQDRVHVLDPVPEEALLGLYSRAMCMVRWGKENGFSFSLVQAVSAGSVPVLSSTVGGSVHLSEEVSPELVAQTDDDFVRILGRLLTDKEYYHKIQSKVVAWRERRPWAAVASDIISALARVAA